MTAETRLGDIFHRVLRGETVRDEDIRFAEPFALDDAEQGIAANSILAIVGDDNQRTIGFNGLRRICEKRLFCGNELAVALFMLTLEHVSLKQLRASQCLIDLIYETAKHPFSGARINAMRALRRLAKIGDNKAIQHLRDSLKDPYEPVSKTAQISLRQAGVNAE